jgi:membrane-associated phospholipid phosphatase
VHYPSDVLTGVAVGAVVAQLVKRAGSRPMSARAKRRQHR